MSEAVDRAVSLVAERVAAAAGVRPDPGRAERFRMRGVSAEEVARRLLVGLLEPDEIAAVLAHLDRRVGYFMATVECVDEVMHARMSASLLMSEVQCFAVGVAFAREGKSSARGVERVVVRGVPMDVEVGPPAHGSFARSVRPAHGGFPGEVQA